MNMKLPKNENLFWICLVILIVGISFLKGYSTTPQERAAARIQDANEALSDGKAHLAENLFNEALYLKPDADTETSIADAYMQHGRVHEAILHANRSNSIQESSDAYVILGEAYQKMGDEAAQREAYLHAIRLNPGNATAYNNLGYFYAERGQYLDEAERYIEAAVRLEPDQGIYIDSLGWVFYQKGEYDKACPILENAVEHTPNDPELRLHLAYTLLKFNKYDEAKVELWKSIAMQPGNHRARLLLNLLGNKEKVRIQ